MLVKFDMHKKALLFVAVILLLGLGCEGTYLRSPQGKLDRVVASGKTQFKLDDIINGDWAEICFLPMSYKYPPNYQYDKKLLGFLESHLKRSVGPKEVGNDLVSDGRRFHLLTDRGLIKTNLNSAPWFSGDGKEVVKCMRGHDFEIQIVKDANGYLLKYNVDNQFQL